MFCFSDFAVEDERVFESCNKGSRIINDLNGTIFMFSCKISHVPVRCPFRKKRLVSGQALRKNNEWMFEVQGSSSCNYKVSEKCQDFEIIKSSWTGRSNYVTESEIL